MKYYKKDKGKKQWDLPDLHLWSPTEWMACTFNMAGEELWSVQYERYVGLFKRLSKYSELVVRPEFSTGNRFHYHGLIKPKDYNTIIPLMKVLNEVKVSYTYNISPINDSIIWYLYCIKDRHFMKPWMHKYKKEYKMTSKSIEGIPQRMGSTLYEDLTKYLDK